MTNKEFSNAAKVGILIDGNNINRGVKSQSQQVDYEALVRRVLAGRALSKFFYFQEGEINQGFAYQLHQSFFGIVRSCRKSADVPLAIEAVQLADRVDTLIIASGDVDYMDLLYYLRSRGVTIEIVSFRDSLSHEIGAFADFVHFVKESDLMKKNIGTPSSPEKPGGAKPAGRRPTGSKRKASEIIGGSLVFAESDPDPATAKSPRSESEKSSTENEKSSAENETARPEPLKKDAKKRRSKSSKRNQNETKQ